MDELLLKIANAYLQTLAWINCGLPRNMVKDAYDLRLQLTVFLQQHSKCDLDGVELARHVFRQIQNT